MFFFLCGFSELQSLFHTTNQTKSHRTQLRCSGADLLHVNRPPEACYQIPFFRGLGEVFSMQGTCATCSAQAFASLSPATALPNIKSKPVLVFQAVLQLPHSSTCQAYACVKEKKRFDFCNYESVRQAKSQCEISPKRSRSKTATKEKLTKAPTMCPVVRNALPGTHRKLKELWRCRN